MTMDRVAMAAETVQRQQSNRFYIKKKATCICCCFASNIRSILISSVSSCQRTYSTEVSYKAATPSRVLICICFFGNSVPVWIVHFRQCTAFARSRRGKKKLRSTNINSHIASVEPLVLASSPSIATFSPFIRRSISKPSISVSTWINCQLKKGHRMH